jgi:hypothetical protein
MRGSGVTPLMLCSFLEGPLCGEACKAKEFRYCSTLTRIYTHAHARTTHKEQIRAHAYTHTHTHTHTHIYALQATQQAPGSDEPPRPPIPFGAAGARHSDDDAIITHVT